MGKRLAIEPLIGLPPRDEWGPHLEALRDDRQRLFVVHMAAGFTAANAARSAGYSDTSEAAKVRAHHLLQNGDVLAALHEVGWRVLRGVSVKAIHALNAVVDNPDDPKHLIAIGMVLDRTGYAAQTEHKVTVRHEMDELQLKAIAARFSMETGVSMQKLLGFNDVIDGEFEPVTEAPDAAGAQESPDLAGGKTEVQ
jgi:hypothetical protein